MQRLLLGMLLIVGVGIGLMTSEGIAQPPQGGQGGKGGPGGPGKGGAGGPGGQGKGGPQRFELGQIFPPPLREELELTADQEKELQAIQKELKSRLEKLLTADQKTKIENFRPRGGPGGPGGRGPGGAGGPGGRGPGGTGAQGDRPPFDKSK